LAKTKTGRIKGIAYKYLEAETAKMPLAPDSYRDRKGGAKVAKYLQYQKKAETFGFAKSLKK
jgi:hypothetical protein